MEAEEREPGKNVRNEETGGAAAGVKESQEEEEEEGQEESQLSHVRQEEGDE